MTCTHALIVGAGPTGMTMAIELKRAGLDVRIIDKSGHLALHSQALVVQARTLEQFQRYGIAVTAVDRGRKLKRGRFWSEGQEIVSIAFDGIRSRYPYLLLLPQSETEAILNQHMESLGVKTERRCELISLSQNQDGVESVIHHADGSTEQIASRWIIGCDGAHSLLRQQCGIPFEGKGIDLSFFLGDLELEGPDAPSDEIAIHLHGGDLVFMARLSDKFTRLIVALHSEQNKSEPHDLTLEDFQAAVDRTRVRVKIRSADWMTPFHVNDRQAVHYRAQSAFLCGDAAHIHSPAGGQGMNTGIQDAANLAWKLAAVARGADDRLLDSYEEERGAVGKQLLKFTERGLKLGTAAGPLVRHLRDLLAPLVTKPKTVQEMMLGFVSETAIEYRSSSVVTDHGGDGHLRAGDRLPDLDIGPTGQHPTLLHDWTHADHLAVFINASDDRVKDIMAGLQHTEKISITSAQLSDEGRELTGTQPKVLLVRPDGYIGFRGPLEATAEWNNYVRQDGLTAAVVLSKG